MKKRCKCILFPSEGKSNIFLSDDKSGISTMSTKNNSSNAVSFHIVSLEEEIKEGNKIYTKDHLLNRPETSISTCTNIKTFNPDKWFKIIASTDNFITGYDEDGHPMDKNGNIVKSLPSIPQSFIEHYITQYNKGNRIEDVMVEYETKVKMDGIEELCKQEFYQRFPEELPNCVFEERPKINPDNTINIKSVKDSWSREEVINLIKTALDENNTQYSLMDKLGIDKWINKNL